MAMAENASFVSPVADAKYAQILEDAHIDGFLATLSGLSGWTVALTLLAMMVAYDQCEYFAYHICRLWIEMDCQLTYPQVAIFGKKDRFLAQHGKFLSLGLSSNR